MFDIFSLVCLIYFSKILPKGHYPLPPSLAPFPGTVRTQMIEERSVIGQHLYRENHHRHSHTHSATSTSNSKKDSLSFPSSSSVPTYYWGQDPRGKGCIHNTIDEHNRARVVYQYLPYFFPERGFIRRHTFLYQQNWAKKKSPNQYYNTHTSTVYQIQLSIILTQTLKRIHRSYV